MYIWLTKVNRDLEVLRGDHEKTFYFAILVVLALQEVPVALHELLVATTYRNYGSALQEIL